MTWHDRVGWWVFLERGNSESCYTAEAGETVAALPPVFLLASTWFFHISVSVSLDTVFIYESLYIYIYMFQDLGPWTTHVNPCSMFALNELHNMISRQLADGIAAGRVWMAALQVLGGMTCHDCMSSCRSGGH